MVMEHKRQALVITFFSRLIRISEILIVGMFLVTCRPGEVRGIHGEEEKPSILMNSTASV